MNAGAGPQLSVALGGAEDPKSDPGKGVKDSIIFVGAYDERFFVPVFDT